MNAKNITVTGPFTHENLSIFLLRGSDTLDGSRFIPLDQALEQKFVTVHETGTVGQLEVENLSDSLDLYTLVQEFEDTYGTKMSDEQAAEILTVGQSIDFVLAHTSASS